MVEGNNQVFTATAIAQSHPDPLRCHSVEVKLTPDALREIQELSVGKSSAFAAAACKRVTSLETGTAMLCPVAHETTRHICAVEVQGEPLVFALCDSGNIFKYINEVWIQLPPIPRIS